MANNILLTGASGGIGYEVFQQLLKAKGIKISIYIRKSKANIKRFKQYRDLANIIYGDLKSKEDLIQIKEPYDAVIHLAAIIPPIAYRSESNTYNVNVRATQNLLDHFESYCPKAFFMFSSSVAIYGDRLETPEIRVTDSLHHEDKDFYVQTKIKAEKAVQKSKLQWSIFRLTAY